MIYCPICKLPFDGKDKYCSSECALFVRDMTEKWRRHAVKMRTKNMPDMTIDESIDMFGGDIKKLNM